MAAIRLSLVPVLAAVVFACTWVEPTAESARVRIVPADRVADCEVLGSITTYTKAQVAGIRRNANKVRTELDELARREAADMGSDTLVAAGPVSNGRRSYTAHRCLP